MIYPCFYGNLAVARQQHACKVTLTWEWPSTGARVAVPFMIWVRTFSRSLCWLCAQICPDLPSSQKDPHGFGTQFRTVARARDYRREHMMPPCDKPDYVEPNDSAHELWTYPWRRRDGQSNDNLHFVSGTTGGSGDVARVEDMINELTAHAARLRSELVALHSKMDETSDRLVSNVKQNMVEDESPVTV